MKLFGLIGVERESYDVRSSGDRRNRVDAHFVAYRCDGGDWVCRFEVPRGTHFKPKDYATTELACADKGYTL